MTRVLALISVLLGMFMPSILLGNEEPGDSLPNWVTSTVEIKTYSVINVFNDSLFFYRFQSSDLGRALSQSGQVNAFQYGPSGTACLIRSKGLAPDHTQVLWNNISMNSLTLGQADLSLIPMFFLHQIRVSSPSFYTLDANSGIGGTIHVGSEVKDLHRSKFWTISESSSIHNFWNGVGCQIKQQDRWGCPVLIQLKAFTSNNLNQFRYQNPYSAKREWEEQTQNNSHARGIQWQMLKTARKGNWVAQYWTVDRTTHLPSIIGASNKQQQRQWDNQNRATVFFHYASNGWLRTWKTGGAFLLDRQKYWMNTNDINASEITSHQSLVFSEWEGLKSNLFFGSRTEWRSVFVNINGFHQWAQLPQCTFHCSNHPGSRWMFNAALKGAKGPESLWNKSALGSVTWMGTRRWFKQLKLQGQWVERAPDFNELYWPQSGNVHLKSEQSWGSALYSTMEFQKNQNRRFRVEGDLEHRWVKNWIQWIPQENGLWRPFNVQQVESWYAQCKTLTVYPWREWEIKCLSFYEWNQVLGWQREEDQTKFNMPYVPRWKLSHQLDIGKADWTVGVSQRWISARYTDQSNSLTMQLPSVQLWNVYLSKGIHFNQQVLIFQIRCENVTNQQYQEVRSYAIPGRVWSIQVNYSIYK